MQRLALLPLLLAAPALGATASLPLHGYYRPDCYLPVRITAATAPTRLTVDGAVPVGATGLGTDAILPLLPTGPPRAALDVTINGTATPLHLSPLSRNQKLVGTAGEPPGDPFPGQAVVTTDLDPLDPLPGPAAAWDALDAVVVRDGARLDLPALLAAGITVVATEKPADLKWPWRREGKRWTLRPPLAGPQSAAFDESVYLPTSAWRPARPAAERGLVLLAAAAFGLMIAAAGLLRRGRWVAVSTVGLLAAGGSIWWATARAPVVRATVTVSTTANGLRQTDTYVYLAAAAPSEGAAPRATVAIPRGAFCYVLAASAPHLARLAPELKCDSAGRPASVTLALPGRSRGAVLLRTVAPAGLPPDARADGLPAGALVNRQYPPH